MHYDTLGMLGSGGEPQLSGGREITRGKQEAHYSGPGC